MLIVLIYGSRSGVSAFFSASPRRPLQRSLRLRGADHVLGRDFLEGVARVHPPLRVPEGPFHRRSPGLTRRLCKGGHVDDPRAIAEIEGIYRAPAAQRVPPKIADRPSHSHRLHVETVRVAEQFAQ